LKLLKSDPLAVDDDADSVRSSRRDSQIESATSVRSGPAKAVE